MSAAPLTGAGGPGLWTPPERLAARRRAFAERLAADGFDAALIFGHGSAMGGGTRSHGGLRFLTDFDGHEAAALLAVRLRADAPGDAAAWLLPQSPFMLPLARRTPGVAVPEIAVSQGPAFLAETFGGAARIALIGFDEAPLGLARRLGGLVERGIAADGVLDALRLVKDADALARHREGAAICDALFGAFGPEIAAAARERRPVWTAQLALESMARSLGAEDCRIWLTVAPQADYPRYWREELGRTPAPGDQILFGAALRVCGCWAHGLRSAALGAPSAAASALARDVEAMLAAGLAALRPGAALSAVSAAMDAVFEAARPDAGTSRFRFAHGLGYGYEEPVVSAMFAQNFGPLDPEAGLAADAVVAPGMVFEMHPNLFVAGVGGAVLGEMVLVTEDGPALLTTAPRTLSQLSNLG